jgi:hypothetical protein
VLVVTVSIRTLLELLFNGLVVEAAVPVEAPLEQVAQVAVAQAVLPQMALRELH